MRDIWMILFYCTKLLESSVIIWSSLVSDSNDTPVFEDYSQQIFFARIDIVKYLIKYMSRPSI